jgi:hypothetical protein
MNINRNNYEEFFIDYLDGRLTEARIIELEDFLLLNPDLREELEGMENIVLDPAPFSYARKDLLKQINLELPIGPDNYDFFLIAEKEGDLNPEQLSALNTFIKIHPDIEKERTAYSNLQLQADKTIIYKEKFQLKKSVFVIYRREIIGFTAIAASIMLMFGAYYSFIYSGIQENIIQTASNEEVVADSARTESREKINQKIIPIKEKKSEFTKTQSAPKINFKVEMPVASLEKTETENSASVVDEVSAELSARYSANNISINSSQLASFDFKDTRAEDKIEAYQAPIRPYKGINLADPSKYLTIDQFAKQKLSELVFGKENKDESLTAFNLVSAGINKINKISGSDMKLEKSIDEQGNEKATKFDSKVLSVTRPVKK